MTNNYYTTEELAAIGFKSVGRDVKVSKKSSIYRPERVVIGNHVTIDDFCLLSGIITLGNHIHIAAYSAFFGGQSEIEMRDFSGLAFRSTIVAESDDYSGQYLTNPTVLSDHREITRKKVTIDRHSVIGTGSVVLPGVHIREGCSIGAMSLVTKSTEPWGIYIGSPCRRIRERKKDMLRYESAYREEGLS